MSWNDTLLASYFLKGKDMPKDWRLTGNRPWVQLQPVDSDSWRCGYCSNDVASDRGLKTDDGRGFIRICPQCNGPTLFSIDGVQWPGAKIGNPVTRLPDEVKTIYEEARSCPAVNAFTGAVMLCRKLLMHVAVEKGAKPDQKFIEYIQWLVKEHYAPRGADVWLEYIRERGNEANHEIAVMKKEDGEAVLRFTEQLLRNVYELPALVPPKPASQSRPGSNAL